jgi:predicted dinucleotide-binding enzyme
LGPFSSGGELIEAAAPDDASLVKAFNTNFAGPLYAGAVDGSPLDAFVAGDDQTAKDTIMRLASDGGLRAIDAGRLRRSRELEALAFCTWRSRGHSARGLLRRSRWCPKTGRPRPRAQDADGHSDHEVGTC